MSGLNRINITIPGSSATAAFQRDYTIGSLVAIGITRFDLYRYIDTRSGNGAWGYYAYGYALISGIITIATVACKGMSNPPSGSNIAAMPDPGVGTTYAWTTVMGAPHNISTSDMGNAPGSSGSPAPQQNNYLWVWEIPAKSPTAPADFTAAVTKMTNLTGANLTYYKYVDSVSGAWAVYAVGLYGGAGTPLCTLVVCQGTPNPPTGSTVPAVSLPAFTQAFTLIGAPLAITPGR